jgi:hypothetical protein
MLLGMPSCKVLYARYRYPRVSQCWTSILPFHLFKKVLRLICETENRGFFNGQGGITTRHGKNAARSPLLSLNVDWKSTLLVSHDSDPRQRSNWTWKKISIVLIWSQIKDHHTDRFQLQFSVTENTVSKSYTGTLEDLKNISKFQDRTGFSGFLLNEPATLLLNQLLFGPDSPWFAK